MKKQLINFFAGIILLIQLSSCEKILSAVFPGLDVTVPDVQVTVPAIIAVSPVEISLGTYSLAFNLDSIVKARTSGAFTANDVLSVKIKQLTINITNADQLNNLANFESARVSLQSNTNNNPVDIFSATFPDSFASSFTSMPSSAPELISYLKGTTLTYTLYGKNRRITTKPLNMVFSVIISAR